MPTVDLFEYLFYSRDPKPTCFHRITLNKFRSCVAVDARGLRAKRRERVWELWERTPRGYLHSAAAWVIFGELVSYNVLLVLKRRAYACTTILGKWKSNSICYLWIEFGNSRGNIIPFEQSLPILEIQMKNFLPSLSTRPCSHSNLCRNVVKSHGRRTSRPVGRGKVYEPTE